MPSTVYASAYVGATWFPQMRKVFRNPRGLKYYYAFFNDYLLRVYKSADGISWAEEYYSGSVKTVSLTYYQASDRLVIYLAFSRIVDGYSIYYRRGYILDDSTAITWNDEQLVLEGASADKTPHYNRPNITIGIKSGKEYVWIGCQKIDSEKGSTVYRVIVVRTTTTFPTGSPSWSSQIVLDSPSSANKVGGISLIAFSAVPYDILAVWYYQHSSLSIDIKSKEVWDGGSRSATTPTISGVNSGLDLYKRLACMVRTASNRADMLIRSSKKGGYLNHWIYTFGSGWNAGDMVSDEAQIWEYGFALSIDLSSSPSILYAFYNLDGSGSKIKYRTSPTDVISWSITETIDDNSLMLSNFSSSIEDYENSVQLIYQRRTYPYSTRFLEVPIVAPPPAEGYSYQDALVCVVIA